MQSLTRIALALLAGLLLAALILVLALGDSSSAPGTASVSVAPSSQFDGAALPSRPAAPGFALRDQAGRRVTLAEQRGHVTVMAFLYSSCGAPCILIAQQIRGALD